MLSGLRDSKEAQNLRGACVYGGGWVGVYDLPTFQKNTYFLNSEQVIENMPVL